MTDIQYHYLFVGDLITTPNREALEIFEGVIIKPAPKLVKEKIKGMIPHRSGYSFNLTDKYEYYIDDQSYRIPLKDELQNYWIVEIKKELKIDNQCLKIALKLSTSDITTIYQGYISEKRYGEVDISKRELYVYPLISDGIGQKMKLITKDSLLDISNLYTSIKSFDKVKYDYIWKAINDFMKVEYLIYPEFRYLSLVSIIECLLITDNSEDSITKQFVKKSIFFMKRLNNPLDIKNYFKTSQIKLDKFLTLLYQYRSKIAHGDFPDFNNKLQEIKDTKKLYDFLYDFVKELILYASANPDLVSDIKKL
jgi:hypothetical protein